MGYRCPTCGETLELLGHGTQQKYIELTTICIELILDYYVPDEVCETVEIPRHIFRKLVHCMATRP